MTSEFSRQRRSIVLSSLQILAVAQLAFPAPAVYRATLLHPDEYYFTGARAATSQFQFGFGRFFNQDDHALLWNGTAESLIDLHPHGYSGSSISGASAGVQVGSATTTVNNDIVYHALMWHGSATDFVDLHPTEFESSFASGVSEDFQVGSGFGPSTNGHFHALLWHGSAASAVDLHPAGFLESFATDMDSDIQVGGGWSTFGGPPHALMWRGTAESVVDLHPAGYSTSHAWGIEGGIIAGSAVFPTTNQEHALIWDISAGTTLDLNPPGFGGSEIRAMSGGFQAGFGQLGDQIGNGHALVWFGTADSAVDLHTTLNFKTEYVRSGSLGVAENGDVVGWAETMSGQFHAIKWSIVPEPPSIVPLVVAMIAFVFVVWERD